MDPIFLSEEEIHAIHLDQLERYGGSAGLRDAGLLRSAMSQPSASFGGQWLHKDLYEMASAYLFSLAMNSSVHRWQQACWWYGGVSLP